jgi:hypothetical protein
VSLPVWSTQFIVYTESTPNTQFDVPAGYTAVIRQLTFFASVAGMGWEFAINNTLGAPLCIIAGNADLGLQVADQVEGRWVVPEGGTMELFFSGLSSGANFYAGGYLLPNAGTR